MIPTPFLVGMDGFREKYWTLNEETEILTHLYSNSW